MLIRRINVKNKIKFDMNKMLNTYKGIKRPKLNKINFNMSESLKLKISIIVIVFTLVPLLALSIMSFISEKNNLMKNVNDFNKSVNSALVERVDSYVKQTMGNIKLAANAVDILAIDSNSQERAMRKLGSLQRNLSEIKLVDKNGVTLFCTDSFQNGVNTSKETWFVETMKNTKYISNSFIDKKTHLPVFYISVPILDQSMKPAGAVCAKVSMSDIQVLCMQTKIGSSGYAYVIDKSGTVLSHKDYKDKVLKEYNAVKNNIAGAVNINKGQAGTSQYKNDKGITVIGTYSRVPLTQWGVITEIEVKEALASVNSTRTKAIILTIIALVFVAAGSFALGAFIVNPLKSMVEVVEEIKDGNLRKRVKVTSKDEIGKLQEAFNMMTESLTTIIQEVNEAVSEVTEASKVLSQSSATAESAAEEISAVVEDVSGGAESQIKNVNEAVAAVEEIAHNVDSAADTAHQVAESAVKSADLAKEGSKNINIINEKISTIKDNVVGSATLVKELGEKTSRVTDVVNIIREIAGRTNMLALNASIEAARAGEAGKGFAVVANEVRVLAEQTKEASKDIEALIHEIQQETNETVSAMHKGLDVVEQGTSAISATYGTFDSIIENIGTVAEDIMTVNQAVKSLKGDMEKVINSISSVTEIARATSDGTQNVLASTEEQSAAIQEITHSAYDLSNMAEKLNDIVTRFKL